MENAIIVNNGLKIDMKNGTLGSSTVGVKIRIGNTVYTVPNFGDIPATYGFNSVIFYNIITNSIVLSTSIAVPSAHLYELCRWVNEAKKWIGNDGNIQVTLSDANTNWNLNKQLYFSPHNEKRIVIDLINSVIEIPSYLHWIYSDTLNNASLTSPQTIDFSSIPNSRTVYLYFDQTNMTFIASADTVKPSNGNRNLYFVTSFRKEATKEAKASYNLNAILFVTANDSEIDKIFRLGTSLTFSLSNSAKLKEVLNQNVEIINAGINGSQVVSTGSNPMCIRINQMPSDTKLLIFEAGTNDTNSTLGSLSPIGSVFDDTTFYGAYQKTIETAYSINPSVRILCIIPSRSYLPGLIQVDRSHIITAIKETTLQYGIPTLNLHDEMGVNELNQHVYYTDLLHYKDFAKLTVERLTGNAIKNYY